ncbi:MAG: DUF4491 family protein [Dysgonamonadaceae bacterium]|jgi:hypothetical protein|nr:DUF4491 family protein [Dysgonamonadaceae bacterium]
MDILQNNHLTGIITGLITFLIIGLFHPLVIKGEYWFGTRCWWVFLLLGIAGLAGSVVFHAHTILSVSCGVFAFSSFWGIGELFEQKKRVDKGWFPKRRKHNKTKDS